VLRGRKKWKNTSQMTCASLGVCIKPENTVKFPTFLHVVETYTRAARL